MKRKSRFNNEYTIGALIKGLLTGVLWGLAIMYLTCAMSLTIAEGAQNGEIVAEGVSQNQVISSKPITIALYTTPESRKKIIDVASDPSMQGYALRLTVSGLAPPDNLAIIIQVFLNKPTYDDPQAQVATHADPYYVGSFTFSHHPPNLRTQVAFSLNPKPTVKGLMETKRLKEDEPFTVTLVAVPLRSGMTIDSIAIPFNKVTMTVHKTVEQ